MNIDFEVVLDKFSNYIFDENWYYLTDYFESLEFKYKKSIYHVQKIKERIQQSDDYEQKNYYELICNPIFFELESFLIAVRSTVDITMHIINFSLELNIPNEKVYLGSIYKHEKLPKTIKNVLHKYTHNRDKQTWNFIYTFRNQIVHEKGISQLLPLSIDLFSSNVPIAYFDYKGKTYNVVTFLEGSVRFLENFIRTILEVIVTVLEFRSR